VEGHRHAHECDTAGPRAPGECLEQRHSRPIELAAEEEWRLTAAHSAQNEIGRVSIHSWIGSDESAVLMRAIDAQSLSRRRCAKADSGDVCQRISERPEQH
jgi:hypothetical protein